MAAVNQEDSQRSLAQPRYATITELPTEMLLKILRQDDEFKTQRALRTLRLVSRGLNAIVQERAAEYIRIRGDSEKVEAMATSPSTFDRSAKTLRLEGFEYPPGHQSWTTLAILIKKMEALKEIQWIDAGGLLNDVVVEAMGHLPLLEAIDFTFLRTSPSYALRLPEAMLARLKSITLNFPCYLSTVSPGPFGGDKTKDNIRYLILNTPRLEHLAVGPEDIANLVSIDEGVTAPTNSRSSLLSISAKAMTILPTSTNSTPEFLSRLSTLEIPNHRSSDWPVWHALHVSGIELLNIKVDVPTVQLVEYLCGYKGLRSFHMGGRKSDSVRTIPYHPEDILVRLVNIGLFKHRTTLVDLRFHATRDCGYVFGHSDWRGCMLTRISERALLRFRWLERLDIVFGVGQRGQAPFLLAMLSHINQLLNNLTMLSSKLKIVCLYIVGVETARLLREETPSHLDPSDDPFHALLQEIDQSRFAIRPSNWEFLQVVVRIFEPSFTIPGLPQVITHIAYRIVPSEENPAKYCLKMDYAQTELLNEWNDYHV